MDSIFSIVFTMNMYLFVHKERGQCLVMCLAGTLNFSLFCATSKDGSLLFRDAHDLEFVSEIDVRKYPFRYHALDLIAENPDCLGLGTYLCSHGLSLLTTVGAEGQITIGPPPARYCKSFARMPALCCGMVTATESSFLLMSLAVTIASVI